VLPAPPTAPLPLSRPRWVSSKSSALPTCGGNFRKEEPVGLLAEFLPSRPETNHFLNVSLPSDHAATTGRTAEGGGTSLSLLLRLPHTTSELPLRKETTVHSGSGRGSLGPTTTWSSQRGAEQERGRGEVRGPGLDLSFSWRFRGSPPPAGREVGPECHGRRRAGQRDRCRRWPALRQWSRPF
jgi:hypothetical protein